MNTVTRTQAQAMGLTNYFTGRPCSRGHVSERNVKGKHCLECRTAAFAAHRAKFTDEAWLAKERARNMDYIHRNRDKKRASARASMAKAYAVDPQRFIDRSRRHELKLMAEAPETYRLARAAIAAAYRVRHEGAVSPRGLTAVVRRVWDRADSRCAVCASDDRLELDHIVPVAHGGGNDEANLQFLCQPCNRSKNDSDFFTWRASRAQPEGLAA